jgi:hypothetical protein
MHSLLEKYDDAHALLLMYLADELSAEERAEVDKQLAADDALRGELESMRSAHQVVGRWFLELDQSQPLPGTVGSYQRMAARMISQWQVQRAMPDRPREQPSQWRWRRLYPVAAAAVLLLGFIVWWGIREEESSVAVLEEETDQFAGLLSIKDELDTNDVVQQAFVMILAYEEQAVD